MPHPPAATPTKAQLAISKVKRMLAVAPEPDLWSMERVRRRLASHEDERSRLQLSPRRTELDGMIARDIERLCKGFKKLERAAGS